MQLRGRTVHHQLRKPICGNCREIAISATVMGASKRERDRRRYGRVRKEERDLVKMRSLG